uniref:DNA repair protein RAD51 4 n=1 Tax=Aceria tosichella TaxID=561515 RepID=A0A6G1SLA6_9ACAR
MTTTTNFTRSLFLISYYTGMAYLSTNMSELLTDEYLDSLQKADIWTINDLCSRDLMDIKRATNIKFHILKDLQDRVKQRYVLPCLDMNLLVEKSIREFFVCPTGLPELTEALDGGFQTQEIVEFSGDSETGKTEMCYLLCAEILAKFKEFHVLYIASNFDFDHEKLIKYVRSRAGELSDEDMCKSLSRVEIARPTKLTELVHLLNTLVHSDRKMQTKCIIIDSISFIIQDDILDIKSANLHDADDLEKFLALKGINFLQQEAGATVEGTRREIMDTYLHEVMRLLVNVAITKSVIVAITNSDAGLASRKSWTNAIDHRIALSKMPEFSQYKVDNPRATVCRATLLKTVHHISKIGHSIPFAITDNGILSIKLAPVAKVEAKVENTQSEKSAP